MITEDLPQMKGAFELKTLWGLHLSSGEQQELLAALE